MYHSTTPGWWVSDNPLLDEGGANVALRIGIRFISADSRVGVGSGDRGRRRSQRRSSSPMAWFSPKRRFVEASGDVIERVLANGSPAVNVNFQQLK